VRECRAYVLTCGGSSWLVRGTRRAVLGMSGYSTGCRRVKRALGLRDLRLAGLGCFVSFS
jgi:hypothetical protein